MGRTPLTIAGALLACSVLAPGARATTVLHLGGEDCPLGTLDPAAPAAATLPNYDPWRDGLPGLLLARGGSGPAETDPARYQQWATSGSGISLDGPTQLEFWAAMAGFGTGERGVVNAYLLDCEATGTDCAELAHGSRDIADWSEGHGSWSRHVVGFGHVTHTVPAGRVLALRVVVGADSDDDMMFAYGTTAFRARLTDAAADDIAVDCSFTDWADGDGIEYVVDDQGGPRTGRAPPSWTSRGSASRPTSSIPSRCSWRSTTTPCSAAPWRR